MSYICPLRFSLRVPTRSSSLLTLFTIIIFFSKFDKDFSQICHFLLNFFLIFHSNKNIVYPYTMFCCTHHSATSLSLSSTFTIAYVSSPQYLSRFRLVSATSSAVIVAIFWNAAMASEPFLMPSFL